MFMTNPHALAVNLKLGLDQEQLWRYFEHGLFVPSYGIELLQTDADVPLPVTRFIQAFGIDDVLEILGGAAHPCPFDADKTPHRLYVFVPDRDQGKPVRWLPVTEIYRVRKGADQGALRELVHVTESGEEIRSFSLASDTGPFVPGRNECLYKGEPERFADAVRAANELANQMN